ncbi:hypothetical protein ACN47E_006224 [Coniothyrium glycines]
MTAYEYRPLDTDSDELRLVTLHPGSHNDPIRITISHVPFQPPLASTSTHVSWSELRASLPPQWSAGETIEGIAIFHCHGQYGHSYSTWVHPDPTFPRDKYNCKYSLTLPDFNPRFEALSYTWGSMQDPQRIEVEASSPEVAMYSSIEVGGSLYDALYALRRVGEPRVLWIDALCINQGDVVERSEQVKRMHQIYTYATRVIVWLGPETHDSTLALQTLENMGKQIEYTKSGYWMPAPQRNERDWWLPECRPEIEPDQWNAIANLLHRPWFGRLWVLQEIQLANHEAIAQCGATEARWTYLRRAFLKCRRTVAGLSQFAWGSSSWLRVTHMYDLSANLGSTGSLRDLFSASAKCDCMDPRDKVYGLLGLLPRPMVDLIRPDYSLPPEDIYKQTFLQTMIVTGRWDIVSARAPRDQAPTIELPSWIPDFSDSRTFVQVEAPQSFASIASSVHFQNNGDNELKILGVPCNHVAAISDVLPQEIQSGLLIVHEFWSSIISSRLYSDGGDPSDTYTWTLSLGKLLDRWTQTNFEPSLADAKTVLENCSTNKVTGLSEHYAAWLEQMYLRVAGKRIFSTSDGRLGIFHEHVKVGDEIAVVLGLSSPVILRPDQNGKYRLLGLCYLHGIMDGEALLGPIPHPWKVAVRRTPNLTGSSVLDMRFINVETGEDTRNDPRLEEVPEPWEPIEKQDEMRLGVFVQHYRNRMTAKVTNSDPRLFPDALRQRGIRLETICLV